MPPSSLGRAAMLAVLALAMAGCQSLSSAGGRPATTPPAPQPERPLVAFVSNAAPGQRTVVNDPDLGNVVVTLERIYFSASQQNCRRFNVRPANNPAAPQETLVMCQESRGWSLVRLPVLQ